MRNVKNSDQVISVPKIKVDEKIIEDALNQPDTEKQVVLNCRVYLEQYFCSIRIWNTTYIADTQSAHKSMLLNCYGIKLAPEWLPVVGCRYISFVLIMEGLPKSSNSFKLCEPAPNKNGFFSKEIFRNQSDIYDVELYV
ncbi:MAG: hypothetical protein ACOCUL_03770 [Bacteroidota bacterium]